MPHGKIQRVIASKTASRHRDLGSRVLPLQIRQKLVDHVVLVLHMPPDPRARMHALVVPALAVHAVHAEYLDRARFQFSRQRMDHPRIFILIETSHRCRKHEDRRPGVSVHQRLHVAPSFVAILFVIFAVHVREDCNRTARSSASLAAIGGWSGRTRRRRSCLRRLSRPSAMNYWSGNPDRRLIPKCFSFDCSVVRFNPNRMAAPFSPPIRPWLCRKARRMCSRSAASRVSSTRFFSAVVLIGTSSPNGGTSTEPCVRITARSIKFSNSRTFPGHSNPPRISIVFLGMLVIDLLIRRANFWTKYSTSNGMSSRRSRNGGTRIGNTFSR